MGERLSFSWQKDAEKNILRLSGSLTLDSLPLKLSRVALPEFLSKETAVIVDLSELKKLDTSGAKFLLLELQELGIATEKLNFACKDEDQSSILKLVIERGEEAQENLALREFFLLRTIRRIGQETANFFSIVKQHITLFGQILYTAFTYILNHKRIRWREIFSQLQQSGLQAIPVVMLVNFLIGIVLAYLLAMQAEKFGATIFVIDGVALAMCREMSPILVAIIIAGRSGSAFTAQLGAMKLTEETDAIRSIGLKIFDVLIFPRILALIIVLPLLVFVGNLLGIYGGMLIANYYLDLTATTFYERLSQVLTIKHILAGIIKAPVFALAIGLIACRIGLDVEKDARSVGLSTTKTVVRSIVTVILLNAVFSVLFAKIGF